jgi:hypothetical protein
MVTARETLGLKPLFWDYDISEELLLKILNNEIPENKGVTQEMIFKRLLESLSWFQILSIIKSEQIPQILNDDILNKMWNKPLQKRYQYAKQFLFK